MLGKSTTSPVSSSGTARIRSNVIGINNIHSNVIGSNTRSMNLKLNNNTTNNPSSSSVSTSASGAATILDNNHTTTIDQQHPNKINININNTNGTAVSISAAKAMDVKSNNISRSGVVGPIPLVPVSAAHAQLLAAAQALHPTYDFHLKSIDNSLRNMPKTQQFER